MKAFTVLTRISKTAYLVAFITFLMRAGHFMSLPFLAIYLAKEGLFTSLQIGLILGVSAFVLSLTGFINGMYVDRSSHKKTIISAFFLGGFCYLSFSLVMQSFWGLLLLNAALGWFRSLAEITAVSILVTNTKPEDLSRAYSARFIAANLGVVLGPFIGAIMAAHDSLFMFYLAGVINIGLGVGLLFYRSMPRPLDSINPEKNVWQNFKEVLKDKILIIVTLINFIIWAVYSQMDTTLPQYLAHTWKQPAVIFSVLMAINAVICIFFQPIIMRWAELTSAKLSGIVGSLLFSISFFILGITSSTAGLIISVILMSFAELFTLPVNSLLIMRVAPKHLIASYNGLANFGLLGLCVGPVLGGFGLHVMPGPYFFMLVGLLPFIVLWQYLKYIP